MCDANPRSLCQGRRSIVISLLPCGEGNSLNGGAVSDPYEDRYRCGIAECENEAILKYAKMEHRELAKISKLIAGLFHLHSESRDLEEGYYYATYDRTLPDELPEAARKGRSGALDGDFFWVRTFDDALVIVFGDAMGHFAYAGGLKMLVGSALSRVAEKHEAGQEVRAKDILSRIAYVFDQVGRASLEDCQRAAG